MIGIFIFVLGTASGFPRFVALLVESASTSLQLSKDADAKTEASGKSAGRRIGRVSAFFN